MIWTGEMIAHAPLPDSLIQPCIAVLDILSSSERDLIRLVVEVINELRDSSSTEPVSLGFSLSAAKLTIL